LTTDFDRVEAEAPSVRNIRVTVVLPEDADI
jgi:hypothetical protein